MMTAIQRPAYPESSGTKSGQQQNGQAKLLKWKA